MKIECSDDPASWKMTAPFSLHAAYNGGAIYKLQFFIFLNLSRENEPWPYTKVFQADSALKLQQQDLCSSSLERKGVQFSNLRYQQHFNEGFFNSVLF